MFYRMYLSSVCHRRQWPEPAYEPFSTRQGHFCKVRVNNREYSTETPYKTEQLARDAAAMKAFMICRDFSRNDGMMPGQRPGDSVTHGGVVQGLPVAIGAGRRRGSTRDSTSSCDSSSSDAAPSGASGSGSSSPDASSIAPAQFYDDAAAFEHQHRHLARQNVSLHHPGARYAPQNGGGSSMTSAPRRQHIGGTHPPLCLCHRGHVQAYGRCGWCLRESGWA